MKWIKAPISRGSLTAQEQLEEDRYREHCRNIAKVIQGAQTGVQVDMLIERYVLAVGLMEKKA